MSEHDNTYWSYAIKQDDISEETQHIEINANEEQRLELAERLNIDSIGKLQADLNIALVAGKVSVSGKLEADVLQQCVVSLDPVPARIEEKVEAWFIDEEGPISMAKARHLQLMKKGQKELPILDEEDDPEVIVDGQIDLVDVIAEHLALALDPYPHAEGVHYEQGDDKPHEGITDERKNPFAALKDWRDKLEEQ